MEVVPCKRCCCRPSKRRHHGHYCSQRCRRIADWWQTVFMARHIEGDAPGNPMQSMVVLPRQAPPQLLGWCDIRNDPDTVIVKEWSDDAAALNPPASMLTSIHWPIAWNREKKQVSFRRLYDPYILFPDDIETAELKDYVPTLNILGIAMGVLHRHLKRDGAGFSVVITRLAKDDERFRLMVLLDLNTGFNPLDLESPEGCERAGDILGTSPHIPRSDDNPLFEPFIRGYELAVGDPIQSNLVRRAIERYLS